jgi:hypothetical protein
MEAQKFTHFEIPNGLNGLNRNVILNFGIGVLNRQDVIDVLRMLNKGDIVKCEMSNSKCEMSNSKCEKLNAGREM